MTDPARQGAEPPAYEAVGEAEFRRRLIALLTGGVGPGLPRKRRDRHILLRSMILCFDPAGSCSEREVGGCSRAGSRSPARVSSSTT